MTLVELLQRAGVAADLIDQGDCEVQSLCADSRSPQAGALYVTMPSERSDTGAFIGQAREHGAVAALVRNDSGLDHARAVGIPHILIRDEGHRFYASLGRLCRASAPDDPTLSMRVIGVTGTNGKSTVAWMLRDALSSLGCKAAYLGTLGFACGSDVMPLANTTPFPVELWTMLRQARQAGCTDLVMEASSHALVQRRLAGVSFAAGVFTNLTQDHLDYHQSMHAYSEAKKLLFTEYAMASPRPFVAVLNTDDPVGRHWSAELPTPVLRFGEGGVHIANPSVGVSSIAGQLNGAHGFNAAVGGAFNIQNLTATAATLLALGYSESDAAHALGQVTPVPGRFESVPNSLGIGVIVDYAHTPDALEKLLGSAIATHPRKIITVFGCGGDRDRTKRPLMAAAAAKSSDLVIATSDNPRTEDPETILDEVVRGLPAGFPHERVTDRREAIRRAVAIAEPGDVVVIAGKGHETVQVIGYTAIPMDDRELAREALAVRA